MKKLAYPPLDGVQKHTELIYNIVKSVNCSTYLELGIYDGFNFDKISSIVDKSTAVDIKDVRTNKNSNFLLMSTDLFFEKNKENFDVIFIDANHSFESVKNDFINSLKILNEFGLIILHDTDPISEFYIQDGYCSDSYKIIDYIYENHKDLDLLTLPIDETGLTIVKRKKDLRKKYY